MRGAITSYTVGSPNACKRHGAGPLRYTMDAHDNVVRMH